MPRSYRALQVMVGTLDFKCAMLENQGRILSMEGTLLVYACELSLCTGGGSTGVKVGTKGGAVRRLWPYSQLEMKMT